MNWLAIPCPKVSLAMPTEGEAGIPMNPAGDDAKARIDRDDSIAFDNSNHPFHLPVLQPGMENPHPPRFDTSSLTLPSTLLD